MAQGRPDTLRRAETADPGKLGGWGVHLSEQSKAPRVMQQSALYNHGSPYPQIPPPPGLEGCGVYR